MPEHSVFRHRLDLLVRLIDTAMGTAVTERGISFYYNGTLLHPLNKGPGDYAFIATGREDFLLTVAAAGYERRQAQVRYAELDAALPTLELALIPGPGYSPARPCHTLRGRLEGVVAVQAVKLGESPCVMREFDERKRVITVFNPHRLALDSLDYAVVDPEKEQFEAFRVIQRLTDQTFKIGRRLERGFGSHFPICRVVHGSAQPDGSYLLRVPNSSGDARWIIRLQRGEEELFCTVDFLKPETTTPEALAAGQEGRG